MGKFSFARKAAGLIFRNRINVTLLAYFQCITAPGNRKTHQRGTVIAHWVSNSFQELKNKKKKDKRKKAKYHSLAKKPLIAFSNIIRL